MIPVDKDSFAILQNKRERVAEILAAGGTPADVAAEFNLAGPAVDRWMWADGQVARATRDTPADVAVQRTRLMAGQAGGPPDVRAGPYGTLLAHREQYARQWPDALVKHFHGVGAPVDPIDGQPGQPYHVWTDRACPLVTNVIVLSDASRATRFSPWVLTDVVWGRPIQVIDRGVLAGWGGAIELTLRVPIDWTIGSPWPARYLDDLVDRWVMGPWRQHLDRAPDLEPVWPDRSPWAMAWWAWDQLECRALLKGLTGVTVRSTHPETVARISADTRAQLIEAAGGAPSTAQIYRDHLLRFPA
jgi:hypothetical protein